MSAEEQLIETLRQLFDRKTFLVSGKVLAVKEELLTCEVEFLEGKITNPDIRLKASEDGKTEGFFLIPTVGSIVQVGLIDEELEGIVLITNQVEKIIYKEGATLITLDKALISLISGGKIEIKNEAVNLKDIIAGIISIVSKIVVVQGTSPDIPGLAELNIKLNQLMN